MEATSLYGRLSTVELGPNAIARLLASDMRADLLAIMPEIFAREAFAERLAYSPDEAAELLGISRELVHDLLRTGQLGSVKAGRRRLIAKHHLEAFLAENRETTTACEFSLPDAVRTIPTTDNSAGPRPDRLRTA
jgi:excisionase family DNA binding protein